MPHFSLKRSQSFQLRRLAIARIAAEIPTPSPTVTSHSPSFIVSPVYAPGSRMNRSSPVRFSNIHAGTNVKSASSSPSPRTCR